MKNEDRSSSPVFLILIVLFALGWFFWPSLTAVRQTVAPGAITTAVSPPTVIAPSDAAYNAASDVSTSAIQMAVSDLQDCLRAKASGDYGRDCQPERQRVTDLKDAALVLRQGFE